MKIPLQKDLTTLMSFKMFFKNGMREPLKSLSRNSSEETNRYKTEERLQGGHTLPSFSDIAEESSRQRYGSVQSKLPQSSSC
jgi:hypothetical protein